MYGEAVCEGWGDGQADAEAEGGEAMRPAERLHVEIIQAQAEGASYPEIAGRLRVSKSCVGKHARQQCGCRSQVGVEAACVAVARHGEIAELIGGGYSCWEVSEVLGVTPAAVGLHVRGECECGQRERVGARL